MAEDIKSMDNPYESIFFIYNFMRKPTNNLPINMKCKNLLDMVKIFNILV